MEEKGRERERESEDVGLIENVCQQDVSLCNESLNQPFKFFTIQVEQADLSKPIDKKLYKGTNPSCHDFNQHTATYDGASLLVGFTTGQIQMVVPGRREQGKLYNEEVKI